MSAYAESLDTKECMNAEQRPGLYFAHAWVDLNAQAWDDLNLCILHMFEGKFLLDTTPVEVFAGLVLRISLFHHGILQVLLYQWCFLSLNFRYALICKPNPSEWTDLLRDNFLRGYSNFLQLLQIIDVSSYHIYPENSDT